MTGRALANSILRLAFRAAPTHPKEAAALLRQARRLFVEVGRSQEADVCQAGIDGLRKLTPATRHRTGVKRAGAL